MQMPIELVSRRSRFAKAFVVKKKLKFSQVDTNPAEKRAKEKQKPKLLITSNFKNYCMCHLTIYCYRVTDFLQKLIISYPEVVYFVQKIVYYCYNPPRLLFRRWNY
jgi:DNA topoisomerase IA